MNGHRDSRPAPRAALIDGELTIDGSPFLILGVELHNSSASTAAYLDRCWPQVERSGANTVLAGLSWAQWEPEEGVFDHGAVDHLIESARERGIRVVLLWFASWKNGVSSYAPGWVRRDPGRFPLAQGPDGSALQALSTFAAANVEADARAFAALMAHVRDVDAAHGTVVMVQVENEVGLLGSARDHSALAETVWRDAVPAAVGEAATWRDLHDDVDRAGELFMAWHYARYLDRVAAAGREEWPLPMYANAWLNADEDAEAMAGGSAPGQYPSGGPVPRVLNVWRAGAPNLDFLAPDIYKGDIVERGRSYSDACGLLFIPEMRRDAPGQLCLAIGVGGAIAASPFGVDSAPDDELRVLGAMYGRLRTIAPQLLAARRRGDVTGFAVDDEHPEATVSLGAYEFRIERDFDPQRTGDREDGYGILLRDGDRYLLAGHGVVLRARHVADDRPAWVLECRELLAGTDRLETLRVLNGDEIGGGEIIRITRNDPPGFGPVPIGASATGLLEFALLPRPVA